VADTPEIVLASASPRRLELLDRLGVEPTVLPPDIDETPLPAETADAYVARLAVAKAAAVAATLTGDALVIAADTTVEIDGDILAKPADAADAAVMLRRLSGRRHRVFTGVAVRRGDEVCSEVVATGVRFAALTEADIEWYVSTGEPLDKAGAYALQGAGGVFVEAVEGSVSNVVGLPLHTVVRLAAGLGVRLVAG
jgi:septum formation protein